MPKDQFGRRIRPSAAAGASTGRKRRVRSARQLLLIKLAAGGLVLLAVGLAVAAAQAK